MHVSDSFEMRNAMRGEDQRPEGFFSYVRLDTRIPSDHPLRAIRTLIDEALSGLSRDFNKLYARDGRPSSPAVRAALTSLPPCTSLGSKTSWFRFAGAATTMPAARSATRG